ncbi:MAG TPA: UPF0182 family protein [Acidimicrobiales bacterium]|nr:UPF0182 family protein [Acidimicrobiales bacterium]
MRSTADTARRRRRSKGRVGLVILGLLVFFGFTSMRGIAGFWTTYLWFDELHLTSVWRGVLGIKIVLVLVFTGAFFALMWANLLIADRLAPRFRAMGPEDELVHRYRQMVGPHAGKVRFGVAALFALLAGTGVSSKWHDWLLFRNAVNFGVKDPQFHRDIGYFVFRLPFLSFLVDWTFVAVVIVLIVTVVAHYLNGGIRMQAPSQRVTPQVKAHISVLLACLALLKALGYYLQRFELSFSTNGVVDGGTYSDVKARLPAIQLLIIISLTAAVLLFVNIWRKGWALPVIAVGLWALISVVVGAIVPAFIQKFTVEPSELAKERPYIERNIKATRAALGLDQVKTVPFNYNESLNATELADNAETVRNVRLWDPAYVEQTFQKLQAIRSYYKFNDVDIDRYDLDGRKTQTIVSARELNSSDLPSQSWVNRHLTFTHGFGALVAPANAVTADGQPKFSLNDIPPVGTPALAQPRLYYGENTGGYAVVKTKQREIDYQDKDTGATKFSSYNGTGGVTLSSPWRRLAFAARFADWNMLISGLITPHSKIVFLRDIGDRVRTAAPFLRYDADPYPVVVDGKLLWVQDAYTTTSRYPYGQRAQNDRLPGGSGLRTSFNYVRNSVKVVTDAYNGTMTFYVVDGKDPLIKAYQKAFPKLFTPGAKMPEELRSHLRYPEDLFRVQTTMYGKYHIENPSEFYNGGDAWDISQDPGSGSPSVTSSTTVAPTPGATTPGLVGGSAKGARMDPTYLLLRLPEDNTESFLILQPFVPRSTDDQQQNLSAFLVAKSDPGEYGQLQAFVLPRGRQIDGPALVDARAAADPDISHEITLLNQQGSEVRLGNVQVIPVETSLLYMRPLYVQSSRNPLPEFKRAIVVFGDKQVIAESLAGALTKIFGAAPATLEETPGQTPVTTTPGQPTNGNSPVVVQYLADAQVAYDAAQAALKGGDLAEYQKQINVVGEKVKQAQAAAGATPSTTTPTSTTTTGPPA